MGQVCEHLEQRLGRPVEEDVSPAAELERLSALFIRLINDHDFECESSHSRELLEHVVSNWEAHFDNYASTLSFDQQKSVWRQMVRDNPAMHLEVQDTYSDLQLENQTANVYIMKIVKDSDIAQIQALCEFKWKLTDDKWICYHYTAMRCVDAIGDTA